MVSVSILQGTLVPKLTLGLFLTLRISVLILQGTYALVPKLTLGLFLTLSVRNGHKFKDWSFRILAYIKSKSL